MSVVAEDRQLDAAEVLTISRAPDHVRHVDDAIVLEQRPPVADTCDTGHPLDSGGNEVLLLAPDQRVALGDDLWAELPPDGRIDSQHAVPEEADDPKPWAETPAAVRDRDLPAAPAREQAVPRLSQLVG